jgi:hypothetical protein
MAWMARSTFSYARPVGNRVRSWGRHGHLLGAQAQAMVDENM